MKKYLIKYYSILVMILFIVDNIALRNLRASGVLYMLIMILLSFFNASIILKYRENIEYKVFAILVSFLILIFSKNIYQALFDISNMVLLIVVSFSESRFVKVLTVLISSLFAVCSFFIVLNLDLFILVFFFLFSVEKGVDDVYQDMNYYCENHYNAYAYSAGAMDKYHYSIGKHYEFLNIDGIIEVIYDERNEKSQIEYENYIKNHNCRLVGEK